MNNFTSPHPLHQEVELIPPGSVYGAVVRLARQECPGEELETIADEYWNFFVRAKKSGRIFYECGEYMPEPPRSAYKPIQYRAAPAADGKIHRLHCKCGELPDGTIFVAKVGDSTFICCERCLPEAE